MGLKELKNLPIGVLKLMQECGLNENCKASDIAFKLAPKINASGRMGSAERAIQLLLSESDEEARLLADEVNQANVLRQQTEMKIMVMII